jgi:hypothetical protein
MSRTSLSTDVTGSCGRGAHLRTRLRPVARPPVAPHLLTRACPPRCRRAIALIGFDEPGGPRIRQATSVDR